MDVEEFLNLLMDRLEGLISDTGYPDFIKEHFIGNYCNEFIC